MSLRSTVIAHVCGLVTLGPALAACTVTSVSSDGGPTADTGTGTEGGTVADAGPGSDADAGTGIDSGGDAPAVGLGFTPSNIDLSALDLSKAGDVVVTDTFGGIINSEAPSFNDPNKVVAKIITLADQTKMAVFVVHSLRVEAAGLIDVRTGHYPIAIVALDTMTLFGSIKVRPGLAGGASNTQPSMQGAGPGGGGGGPSSQTSAGGGGSFCGVGGLGAAINASAYPKSAAYGNATLIPLVGGSAGGLSNGSFSDDSGSGGGAIQLVAGTSIDMRAGAFISAPGAGGSGGGLISTQPAAGGGSGGAILIEAPTVKIAGVLSASGGGGGGWHADSGQPGHDSDNMPAFGGYLSSFTDAGPYDHGGNGSAGDTADGADGVYINKGSAPGGGGGAGRIRINTSSGTADLAGATLSPSAMTGCLTQGMLMK